MSNRRTSIDPDTPLTVQALREMIREARGGFVPDYVGGILLHRIPSLVESEAQPIAEILHGLVEEAGARLHDAGIEPLQDENAKAPKLQKREREYVANIAALAIHEAEALMLAGLFDEALARGREALAWCRMVEDHLQAAIIWRIITTVCSGSQQLEEQEHGARRALDEARLSGNIPQVVAAIDFLCSFLVVQYRIDEAEALNDEGLALAKDVEEAWKYYPGLLLNSAQIRVHRTSYVEGIRMCREALRWCEDDRSSMARAAVLSFLGATYLRLGQYRQCLECHHEVIRLAESVGADAIRGWGYFRLAEAYYRLKEMKQAEEMLDRAEGCTSMVVPQLAAPIRVKRTQIYAATDRLAGAADLCRQVLDSMEDNTPAGRIAAYTTLAEIEERRERFEEAEQYHRRAIEISKLQSSSLRTPAMELSLAELLHRLGRDREVDELLAGIGSPEHMAPVEQVRMFHLRAAIAEKRGDLANALEHEREGFAIERELLERRAEESLRNARIVADTDLLEREADLERERRRRLERELADAIVELGDRRRMTESVEQRLRVALREAGMDSKAVTTTALREMLAELRSQEQSHGSPLRYLGGVDEDFYRRLRERFPDLTSKQERLCALLRAGLASKQISALLDLGAEGLKAQRKRLRRRLGLNAEERLETVLAEL